MSNSWEYRVLWEYAGLNPPDFHEDDLAAAAHVFNDLALAILGGAGTITHELMALVEGNSSAALTGLNNRWHDEDVHVLTSLAGVLGGVGDALGKAVTLIYEWKANLVLAIGLADMGLTFYYVGTLGIGPAVEHTAGHAVLGELQRRLKEKLDALEAELVSLLVEGTPLHEVPDRVARELDALIRRTIVSVAGHAAAVEGARS